VLCRSSYVFRLCLSVCLCVELCEAVEQHDQQVTNCLLPVIKQRLDEATQALSSCLEVKDVVVHWYIITHFI